MTIPRVYLVRYGLMRHVGRFLAEGGAEHRRGEMVVVRSRRGDELGEVLSEVGPSSGASGLSPLLRTAGAEDVDRARRAAGDRNRRLAACERIFLDGRWPLEMLDVEPLLDDRRTVLHYLGPHHLDASGLIQALRDRCGLDVVLEPVGRDAPDEIADEDHADSDHGCGSCSTGGGCGSKSGGGCGTESGGCSGCSVKDLVAASRAARG